MSARNWNPMGYKAFVGNLSIDCVMKDDPNIHKAVGQCPCPCEEFYCDNHFLTHMFASETEQ